nr:hypothetical protein CFP56_57431 [Quercus suber]
MEEGVPQQPLVGPQQTDANQHQAESRGSQHSNPLADYEHEGDREGSTRTTHADRSPSRGEGPVRSGGNLQRKINKLKRELRYERRRRKAHNSKHSSEESDDTSYRQSDHMDFFLELLGTNLSNGANDAKADSSYQHS